MAVVGDAPGAGQGEGTTAPGNTSIARSHSGGSDVSSAHSHVSSASGMSGHSGMSGYSGMSGATSMTSTASTRIATLMSAEEFDEVVKVGAAVNICLSWI